MRPLTTDDIVSNAAYEQEREAFRRHVIALKKVRRVAVGPRVAVVFENRDTMRFQIQEMMRIEHIEDPEAIRQEVETYNDLLPEGLAIGATLLIELTHDDDIPAVLRALSGIEHTVVLDLGDRVIAAEAEAGRSTEETTSSVHYLTFRFQPEDLRRLADQAGRVALEIRHSQYSHRTVLAPATVAALVADLTT
ncbi:MAG: DUF3501 family protein [Firmicutes bacterium]|nr:DUF3501 family protein [Alicyclobacillaceae bacterium]MCL6497468.1 DUF3501 family protein [Bacillota bacterium]